MSMLGKSTSGKDRLGFLDALRGFAALSVLAYHVALIPIPNLAVPYWIAPIVLNGATGVTLFFVVSAFALSYSIRQRAGDPHSVRRFYVRRIFRVAPLFYVWLVLTWFRDQAWFGIAHPAGVVLLNAVFGFNLVPGLNEGIVWASWTLGVEMLFYLLFPLFNRYVTSRTSALAFLFVTLALSRVFTYWAASLPVDGQVLASYLQYGFFRQLPAFAAGMLAFQFYEAFVQRRPRDKSLGLALLGASIFVYSALLSGLLSFALESLYWQVAAYGLLLMGLAVFPVRALVNRLSRFFGTISYSLYLNHPTLVFALVPAYRFIYGMPLSVTAKYGGALLLTLLVLTAGSYLTYRFIERPGMQIGDRLIRWLEGRTRPALPSQAG